MNKHALIGIVSLIILAILSVSANAQSPAEETFPFVGVVNVKNANIRAGQAKSFESIAQVKQGEELTVINRSFSWYEVRLPQTVSCYVHADFVKYLRDDIGEISGKRVNVRAQAKTGSAVLGQVSAPAKVKILGREAEGWYRIEPVSGVSGWIQADLVDFRSLNVPSEAVVELPSQNIYEKKRQQEAEAVEKQQEQLQDFEKKKQEALTVKGTIRALEPVLNDNVRHRLDADGGQTFYLQGYRSVLDGFLNLRVQIQGMPQSEVQADQPILLVTQVQLVL